MKKLILSAILLFFLVACAVEELPPAPGPPGGSATFGRALGGIPIKETLPSWAKPIKFTDIDPAKAKVGDTVTVTVARPSGEKKNMYIYVVMYEFDAKNNIWGKVSVDSKLSGVVKQNQWALNKAVYKISVGDKFATGLNYLVTYWCIDTETRDKDGYKVWDCNSDKWGLGAFELVETVAPKCGDGVIQSGEECDDGVKNSDTVTDACRSDCMKARCGDGVQDSNEGCDDGNIMDGDGCSSSCIKEVCGDGVAQSNEDCDKSDDSLCPGACRPDCSCASVGTSGFGFCGDTVVQPPEECEPPGVASGSGFASAPCFVRSAGVITGTGSCDNNCKCVAGTPVKAKCGDGVADPGEMCGEPGLVCKVGETCSACRCLPIPMGCGDGTIMPTMGEQCDYNAIPAGCAPGELCTANCVCKKNVGKITKCGDGKVTPPEQCEKFTDCPVIAGSLARCLACACSYVPDIPVCGDGIPQPPTEDCDPPGSPSCLAPVAGGGCAIVACDSNCKCPDAGICGEENTQQPIIGNVVNLDIYNTEPHKSALLFVLASLAILSITLLHFVRRD